MEHEFEVVSYKHSSFQMILVDLIYRTPHIHKDIEVSLILENNVDIIHPDGTQTMHTGDFYVTNPFVSHELSGSEPCRILAIQIPQSYFKSYFPQIEMNEFSQCVFHKEDYPELCRIVREHMLATGYAYFSDDELKSLACASHINALFMDLMLYCPRRVMTEKERQTSYTKGRRMQKLLHFIDANHEEKVLLSDFAREEGLDLYYLSHSFKEYIGISFQEYVLRVRCEHASKLLLSTNYTILDISLRCGFSDPKYMKKGFEKQFGCSPKEYRKKFHIDPKDSHQPNTITNQDIIAHELCHQILENYL